MASQVDGNSITLTAAAALSPNELVYVDSNGQAAISGTSNNAIGTVHAETASGAIATIILLSKEGTIKLIASEAIALTNVPVYLAASGKAATTGTIPVGIPLEAASGNGAVFEAIPLLGVTLS